MKGHWGSTRQDRRSLPIKKNWGLWPQFLHLDLFNILSNIILYPLVLKLEDWNYNSDSTKLG